MRRILIKNFLMFTFCLTIFYFFSSRPIYSATIHTTPYSFFGEKIDFELSDANGILHKLNNYHGQQCIVCFIKSRIISKRCLLIHYLSSIYNWLKERNIMLVGVSTESIVYDSSETNPIQFPILLDRDHVISKKYFTDLDSKFSMANTTFILDEKGIAVKILNPENVGDIVAQIVIHVVNRFGEDKNNTLSNIQENTQSNIKKDVQEEQVFEKTEIYRSPAPDFELPNHEGKLIKLSDYRGKWCLVAFANKINNSSEYERFLYMLATIYPWLRKQNVDIICASTESVQELARYKKNRDLRYCLVSDSKCIIPELFQEPWSFYNEFLSYLVDPKGNKVTAFLSGSAELHFAQLCRYIITKNPTVNPNIYAGEDYAYR